MSRKPAAVASPNIDALAEEIAATFTERVYNAREEVIRAHWEVGKAMHDHLRVLKKPTDGQITLLVKSLVERGAAKDTTLWLSYKFHKQFPRFSDIDKLGHGKNISWNKIRLALGDGKEQAEKERVISFEVSPEAWETIKGLSPNPGDTIHVHAIDAEIRITIKAD